MLSRNNQHHYRREIVMGKTRGTTAADMQAFFLAQAGKSMKVIIKATGLTAGQIRYFLNQYNVKLSDYREDRTEFAKQATRWAMGKSDEKYKQLQATLLERIAEREKYLEQHAALQIG